jgi:hypothetical protein
MVKKRKKKQMQDSGMAPMKKGRGRRSGVSKAGMSKAMSTKTK